MFQVLAVTITREMIPTPVFSGSTSVRYYVNITLYCYARFLTHSRAEKKNNIRYTFPGIGGG
jgi:hypothetical protein